MPKVFCPITNRNEYFKQPNSFSHCSRCCMRRRRVWQAVRPLTVSVRNMGARAMGTASAAAAADAMFAPPLAPSLSSPLTTLRMPDVRSRDQTRARGVRGLRTRRSSSSTPKTTASTGADCPKAEDRRGATRCLGCNEVPLARRVKQRISPVLSFSLGGL